jgi:hypothetical protein
VSGPLIEFTFENGCPLRDRQVTPQLKFEHDVSAISVRVEKLRITFVRSTTGVSATVVCKREWQVYIFYSKGNIFVLAGSMTSRTSALAPLYTGRIWAPGYQKVVGVFGFRIIWAPPG